MSIPSSTEPLLLQFSFAFTDPTFQRYSVLMLSAILTSGRRTISNLLRTVPGLMSGDPSTYRRVFSLRRWSTWKVARVLISHIISHYIPEGDIHLAVDDTVDEHRGKKVYGKACHRDAVRSTHSFTAFRWGHKWVVLTMLVQFPWASRHWALPVLVALYHSEDWNKKHGRRHKTPAVIARQLWAVIQHWFPDRKFILAGDGGFSTHDLASSAQRRRKRTAVLVGRFYPDANLYAPPPQTKGSKGRPRKKGPKLPSPQAVVKKTKIRDRLTVLWYGGQTRRVEVVTGTGHWHKAGKGLVEVRWVFVHDLTGTHRDEYFFSTDIHMTPQQIIETYTGRWSIEVMFEEMRAHLGLETTRGRSRSTVLRMVPSLFGLYSVVALLFDVLPEKYKKVTLHWDNKTTVSFSDAITAVRRWLWREWVFANSGHKAAFAKLPRDFQELLCSGLAPAA
jgi:hypothetical protein